MSAKLLILVGLIVAVSLASGALVLRIGPERQAEPVVTNLAGNDFGLIRRQALAMFPRGLPLKEASAGLQGLGFRCTPARHMLANINAPSVTCDSAGRGFPVTARLQVTVMARNGVVADIAVSDGFDPLQADARTPDPERASKEPGAAL